MDFDGEKNEQMEGQLKYSLPFMVFWIMTSKA